MTWARGENKRKYKSQKRGRAGEGKGATAAQHGISIRGGDIGHWFSNLQGEKRDRDGVETKRGTIGGLGWASRYISKGMILLIMSR